MAMTGSGLAAARKAKLEGQFGSPDDQALFDSWLLKDSEAIVEYIQGNAVVTSSVAVASVSGVTPGGGSSGSGTGTATGTVG
mgnify:CR=1 FL=1